VWSTSLIPSPRGLGSTPHGHCPCIVVLQKSSGRSQAQRNAPSAPSGSKACTWQEAGGRGPSQEWNTSSAQAPGPQRGEERTEHPQAWAILNHVNAHVSEKGRQAARASARKELQASDGGRCLGPKKRTSFTGPARNRSWRPSSSRITSRKANSTSERAEEATETSAALAHEQPPGAQRRARTESTGERSGDRVVKREPPRSHLHRAAPSFSVPGHFAPRTSVRSEVTGTRRDVAWVGTR